MIAIALILAMFGGSMGCVPASDETLMLLYPDRPVCPEHYMEVTDALPEL